MLTMQGQQAAFSCSAWAGAGCWRKCCANELPFPCGLAWPPFGWWDCGRARCGFDRDWAVWDWPLTKLGPVDLLFDDQCTSQPRAENTFHKSPDMTPFPHRSRDMERSVGRGLSPYFVFRRNTAACMATTTASHKLGSPRGFSRLPGTGRSGVGANHSGEERDLDFGQNVVENSGH